MANTARNDPVQFANAEATCSLVKLAAKAGASVFIGIGSQAEYGPHESLISEDTPCRPTTLYGAAKLSALTGTQILAAETGMRHVWLRVFSLYGPGDHPGWMIPSVAKQMLSGTRPKLTQGMQTWDFLHVEDAARAVMATVSEAASGVYNLASGLPVRIRTVIETLRDQCAPELELIFGEIPFRPDQVMSMQVDISRLNALGGSPTISLQTGLSEFVTVLKAS